MKRGLFLLLLFFSFLDASYLNTKARNHCITDLVPRQNGRGWCYHDINTGSDECDRRLTLDDLVKGYEYLDGKCVLRPELRVTGLTQNQWNNSMIYLAHALGFTFFFLVNFLAVLISRK